MDEKQTAPFKTQTFYLLTSSLKFLMSKIWTSLLLQNGAASQNDQRGAVHYEFYGNATVQITLPNLFKQTNNIFLLSYIDLRVHWEFQLCWSDMCVCYINMIWSCTILFLCLIYLITNISFKSTFFWLRRQ